MIGGGGAPLGSTAVARRGGAFRDRRQLAFPAHGLSLFARFRRRPVRQSTGFTGSTQMSEARSIDHSAEGPEGRHRGPASSDDAETAPRGKHRRPSDD